MIKGFQPAKFSPCSTLHCNEKEEKCQLANYTDHFEAQFNDMMNLLVFTNRVTDGDFSSGALLPSWPQTAVALDDWVWNANHAEIIHNEATAETLYQENVLDECVSNYFIQFDYVIPSPVELEFGCSSTAGTLTNEWGTIPAGSGTYQGIHSIFGDYVDIYFWPKTGNSESPVTIDNIIVYGFLATPQLRDCCDNYIKSIDPCDLYYTSGCGDDWGLAFNWNDYVSTPWKVKVCFPDMELIRNAEFFFTNLDWNESGSGQAWTFAGGLAYVALTSSTVSKLLYQDVDLPICDYSLVITYEATNPFSDGTVYLYINNEIYDSVTVGAGFVGNTTFAIDYDYHIEMIGLYFTSTGNQTVSIDSVSIVKDICSECYCVGDHDCSNLIEARNNNDAFGLVFGATTVFSLRVESELLNYKDEATESIIEGSAGTNQLYFAQFKGLKDLKIYGEPEYVWEALQMMMRVTDMRINKVRYTKKEGNFEMTFNRTLQEYSGSILVMKKTQDYKSYY